MFDLRYHVWSLAAVFLALVIGIVVGVGLSGTGVADKADLQVAQRDLSKAQADNQSLRAQREELRKTNDAFEIAYPELMHEMLRGRHVAVLFVGPVDGGIMRAIKQTLEDANGPDPLRIRSINVPIDAQVLDDVLFNKGAEFIPYVGDDKLDLLGRDLGAEFVRGGQTPLWNTLARRLVEEGDGSARPPADAVVVVRTAKPQQGETARFLHGLLTGLANAGSPAIGVERTDAEVSAVPVFDDLGLSTVDDIDLQPGRLALALLVAGADSGHYGIKATANQILPPFPVA